MTKEDKNLVMKDIAARIPYGVIIKSISGDDYGVVMDQCYMSGVVLVAYIGKDMEAYTEDFLPYLRSMTSMTKEEWKTYRGFFWNHYHEWDGHSTCTECIIAERLSEFLEFIYSNHFDYWGLIPKGLAIEVTAEDNPYERIDKDNPWKRI